MTRLPLPLARIRATIAFAAVTALAACAADPGAASGGPDVATEHEDATACPVVEVSTLPPHLSATGLFADVAGDVVAACVRPYSPRYPLWSDGASKRRFVFLPSGAAIDDSDVDNWQLPVGTRLWKEFTRDGRRVETRVQWRTADGWKFGAYLWDADGKDATLQTAGVTDAMGTHDDVPDPTMCVMCHGDGAATRPLGFSALQLAHAPGGADDVTLGGLLDEGRLSHSPRTVELPGTPATQKTLGWMHANCGTCHRDGGLMADNPMRLALTLDALGSVAATPTVHTTVGRPSQNFPGQTLIVAGNPGASLIFHRASTRDGDGGLQMPPVGTEIVDDDAVAGIERLIHALGRGTAADL